MPTEKELEEILRDFADIAKNECGYKPLIFLKMLDTLGAIETVYKLLNASKLSDGFITLWEKNRLDLSVEHLILRDPWSSMFSQANLNIARNRLRSIGFNV